MKSQESPWIPPDFLSAPHALSCMASISKRMASTCMACWRHLWRWPWLPWFLVMVMDSWPYPLWLIYGGWMVNLWWINGLIIGFTPTNGWFIRYWLVEIIIDIWNIYGISGWNIYGLSDTGWRLMVFMIVNDDQSIYEYLWNIYEYGWFMDTGW